MVLLYKRRGDFKTQNKPSSLISREGAFLLTNIILVVLVLVILTGTVVPRIVEALGGTSIALERSYFDSTCGPIMLLLVLLMGVCPLLGWGKSIWKSSKLAITLFLAACIVVSIAIPISGIGNWYIAAVILCGLPLFVIFREWWRGTSARHRSKGANLAKSFISLIAANRTRYGGFLAHIGIVLLTLGIIASSFYSIEKTATLDIGDSMSIGKYELSYDELVFKQDNEKINAIATLLVSMDGQKKGTLRPNYAYWFSHDNFYAEVAVRTTAAEDLFVSLVWTEFDPNDRAATFRMLMNRLIVWIWVGGVFFLIGGAVSFSSRGKELTGGE
jgi:cytochrome c-type biogenesis protein CcmF